MNLKKIMSLLLVVVMSFSLMACGETGTDAPSPTDAKSEETIDQPADATPEPDKEASGEKKTEKRKIEKTAVQEEKQHYISISKAKKYNKKIITDELLKNTTLGEVKASKLPYWTGYNIEHKAFTTSKMESDFTKYSAGAECICEEEISFLEENGFNCARVLYSFSYLSDPDNPQKVDKAELDQLDEVISWGLKHNVHIMISITGIPGIARNSGADCYDENVATNDKVFSDSKVRKWFASFWDMLSKRYKKIPSGALSFELMAEPMMIDDDSVDGFKLYFDTMLPIIKRMKKDNPRRIIIANDDEGVVPEEFAKVGVCPSLHTCIYTFSQGCLEKDYGVKYEKVTWPMQYFPFHVDSKSGTFELKCEKALKKSTMRLYVDWIEQCSIEVKLNNKITKVKKKKNYKGTPFFEVKIPKGTKNIKFRVVGEWFIQMLLFEIESKDQKITIPTTMIGFRYDPQPMPKIRLNKDGTLTNLSGQDLDADFFYKTYIRKLDKMAQKHGVSLIITETCGGLTENRDYDLDGADYIAQCDEWLKANKKHNIGWMYSDSQEMFGPGAGLFLGPGRRITFENFSDWKDTYFMVNDDVLNVMKKYR